MNTLKKGWRCQTSKDPRSSNGILGREEVARNHTTEKTKDKREHSADVSGLATVPKKGKKVFDKKASAVVYMDEAGPTTINTIDDGPPCPVFAGGTDVVAASGRWADTNGTKGAAGVKVAYSSLDDEKKNELVPDKSVTDTGVVDKVEVEKVALSGDRVHPVLDHREPGDGPTKLKVSDDRTGRTSTTESTNLDPEHDIHPRPNA